MSPAAPPSTGPPAQSTSPPPRPVAHVPGLVANNPGYIPGTGRFVGGLNNNAGGTIRLESGDDLIIDTVGPTNAGTIELAGGTVEYSKTLSNSASGIISGRGV